MTEAAKKLLLFAAALLITVGLIFISFDVYKDTKKIADNINQSVANSAQKIQEEHITKYANSYISGALVVSYVQEIYDDVVTIEVTPLNNPTYDAKAVSEDTLYRDMKTMSNMHYIDPLKNFYITVERNANGIITTVTITEEN